MLIITLAIIYMVKTAFENNVEYHRLSLHGNSKPFRLFFISDIHARTVSEKMLKSLNQTFDAVIIGGDLADERTKDDVLEKNIQLLTGLGRCFFVWGNNDTEVGEEKLLHYFEQYGVTVLSNDAVRLVHDKDIIAVSAIADTSTRQYDIDCAFAKIQQGDHVVFVSHNPAVFARVRQQYRADLMLGGHLHGGQIRVGPFGIHPHGSYKERDGCMTLVSNGYGTTLLPLRLFAKPQCHVIDLFFSGNETGKSESSKV